MQDFKIFKTRYGSSLLCKDENSSKISERLNEYGDITIDLEIPYIEFKMDYEDTSIIYISFVYVPEELRFQGIGKEMLKMFIEHFKEDPKIKLLTIVLGQDNDDIDLNQYYKNIGFKEFAIKSEYEMFYRV